MRASYRAPRHEATVYKLALALATSLFVSSVGCSDPPASFVDCSRGLQAGDTDVVCNGGDNNDNNGGTAPAGPAAPVILQAGCYQDLNVCPPAFSMSWLVEHCTVPYVCPVRDYDAGPEQTVCLRFIEIECWDKYSN